MSKLAIILCVFFASAAHSKYSLTITAELDAFEKTLNTTISSVQEKFGVTREQIHQIAKSISETATKFSLNTEHEIFLNTQKIGAETSKLADNAKDLDINDCLQYPNHLNVTAKAVILKMSACFAEKLRTGLDQIVSIDRLFTAEFARLEALRKAAQGCTENLDDPTSAFGAVLCIRGAGLNVTESGNFNNELTAKTTTLNSSFEAFEPLLADCNNTEGLASFHEESAAVVEKTDKCIKEKQAH